MHFFEYEAQKYLNLGQLEFGRTDIKRKNVFNLSYSKITF